MKKIAIICIFSMFCIGTVQATPSVRKLGGTNTFVGTHSAMSARQKTIAPTARLGSLRSVKPANIQPANTTKSGIGKGNTVRLSKSVVNSNVSQGVVKPVNSYIQDSSIEANIQNHISDADVHVTASDKAAWDAKQDALTAGDGISISNGVISSTVTGSNVKIPVGSENAAPTATIWVE